MRDNDKRDLSSTDRAASFYLAGVGSIPAGRAMKQKWLDRRIGREGPYLALCLSEKEFNAVARRLGIGTAGWLNARADATMHSFYGPAGLCCVVCLGDTSKRDGVEISGLLIHEAVHIWQAWCSDVGESSPGDEQEAYAIQAIAQELMAEYSRRARELDRQHE